MNTRLEQFMAARAAEVYPEPRHEGHDKITMDMARHVAALLPVSGKVLDVGCGQGPALEWFTDHGFDPTGITLSNEDARVCNAMAFTVWIKDQNAMLFDDGCFDCVWARHVLEHSPIPYFTLTEFARVLKPQGILYAEMPAPATACAHHLNENHYSVLGIEMWKSLIHRAGFEIIEGRNINLTTPAGPDLYWSLICRKL